MDQAKVDTEEQNVLALSDLAAQACKPIDIGTAVLPKLLMNDKQYADTVRSEFNAVVIEHHMKWAPLCQGLPGPLLDGEETTRAGRYDFHYCDQIVDWALKHNIKVKGHVLVWHVTTPSWVEEMTADELSEQIRRHIFTTMGHFRGRIKCYDIVNESLAPDGSLANNIFLRKLGPGYIEQAFRWANEADPDAFLIYNDNKVEGCGLGNHSLKSDSFYNLLKKLKNKGVPVHGAGLQAHFNAAGVSLQRPPSPLAVKQQIRRLGQLGLKVNISEMDVRASKLPTELRSVAQCDIYRDILSAALSEPAFDGIWLWGFTDKHTWVKDFYYEDEPLIFDKNYKRKDTYFALQDAIKTLCLGGTVGGSKRCNDDKWGLSWMQPEPEEDNHSTKNSDNSAPDWLQ